MNMCADIELLKAKVPRICPSTEGVPVRRGVLVERAAANLATITPPTLRRLLATYID
jgi:hypothetical protein